MSSNVFEIFFSHFSGKGAKRKRKVGDCLYDVFYATRILLLLYFFHYATKEISQWKLNVTYVFFFLKKLVEKIAPNGVCLLFVYQTKVAFRNFEELSEMCKNRGDFNQ